MSYIPYLIANYSSGLDNELQPWLLPDDAQEDLFDGDVYRGQLFKRAGYTPLATGERDGVPYTESRIVHKLSAVPMVGLINSANKTYTLMATTPIARGTFVVTGTIPAQTVTDDGLGGFTGDGVGTIDYSTGAVSITFTTAPTGGTVTATYNYYPGNPVMMIATFITGTNIKQSIFADTQYVNRWNTTTNRLDDISPATPYTGTKFNFFSWVNYKDASNNPRLLFANNKDVIQKYDGTTVADYVYTSATITSLTCLQMFEMKDRLILIRTNENGTIFPQRIRISGTGVNTDNFNTSATGAGFIDIPDGTWIQGAAFNRDDLIIFTEASTWKLSYSGNDTVPFNLTKIDESRGSGAAFSVITYLNRTSAASPRGLIISDGYRVERSDQSLPDFSYNEIDPENFELCFTGVVDEDRDHWMLYPEVNQDPSDTKSTRILNTNYEENNYSIYRVPLSCMGTALNGFDITWNDLLIYPNWASFSAAYGNWYSFAFSAGSPFSVGGGHHGEIWRLNVNDLEDNEQKIRNITVIDEQTLEITTDWNNYSLNQYDPTKGADTIYLTAISGMVQANDKQYPIKSITDNYTFRVTVPNTTGFSAYTSGGIASRVIPFSALFKKFNPFVNTDKKVRCGWIYFYVSSSGTNLTRNIGITNISQSDPAVIATSEMHNLQTGDQVSFFSVGGMTELNDNSYFVTVLSDLTFSLQGIDSTGFTQYTSGGYVTTPVNCRLDIDIITNDTDHPIQVNNVNTSPLQANCTNLILEDGSKKWYKAYINQTGRFIQFRVRNLQAGSKIYIDATMPGFQPVGRLI